MDRLWWLVLDLGMMRCLWLDWCIWWAQLYWYGAAKIWAWSRQGFQTHWFIDGVNWYRWILQEVCKLPESRDTFYFRSCSPHQNTLSKGDNSFRSNAKTGCSKIAERYTLLLRSQKSHTIYIRKHEIRLEWMECESGLQWESGKVSFFLGWDFKPFILSPSIVEVMKGCLWLILLHNCVLQCYLSCWA